LLNELVKLFSGRGQDRRGAERVKVHFGAAWLRGTERVAAHGLEISEKGVLLATKEAPPGAQVDVLLDLHGRAVKARLKITRRDAVTRDGVPWTLLAGDFQGIAADDWDAVVRFCKHRPEPVNKAHDELAALARTDDDAYRLLPLKVQERVVQTLIAAGRLAPESDAKKNPLVRIAYGGATRTGGHVLLVHSRRNQDGEVLLFDSRLTVDAAGNVALDR
jgi:hypothetical protein